MFLVTAVCKTSTARIIMKIWLPESDCGGNRAVVDLEAAAFFPQEVGVVSLPVPGKMQHKGRGWWRRVGVVRPVNNPLYSLRANKNANVFGGGDGIVWRGSTKKNADRGFLSFLFLPACLWWWDRYAESRSYQAAQTWCWELVIHYRWQPLGLSMHSCCREGSPTGGGI